MPMHPGPTAPLYVGGPDSWRAHAVALGDVLMWDGADVTRSELLTFYRSRLAAWEKCGEEKENYYSTEKVGQSTGAIMALEPGTQ